MTRYWLKKYNEHWQEVNKNDFIQAEKDSGLHSPHKYPATSGFSLKDTIQGRVTKEKYNPQERYKHESDFLALLKTPCVFPQEDE